VDELLERDACMVYAAAACGDSALVKIDAGLMLQSPFISVRNEDVARREMETNCCGTLEVTRRLAPVLVANSAGAPVNMLSIVGFYARTSSASYCGSKAAQWALANALRIELNGPDGRPPPQPRRSPQSGPEHRRRTGTRPG
jgi:NADP-dependent 3-hydroxy acid dehydrogenase YdfG